MIYVHAYPFRVDDPERNVRAIIALARHKSLSEGDVLIFPFQALTGTVQDYWSTGRRINKEMSIGSINWLSRLQSFL